MARESIDERSHKGKAMMTVGLILLLAGLLRLYNVDWPVVMIVIGAVLMLKGILISKMRK